MRKGTCKYCKKSTTLDKDGYCHNGSCATERLGESIADKLFNALERKALNYVSPVQYKIILAVVFISALLIILN